MAYRIVYADAPVFRENERLRIGTVAGYTLAGLAVFGLLTVKFWPGGREALAEFLLPGDPAVTCQALENMASNLRAGEAIGDAAMVFCREIMDGAQISD